MPILSEAYARIRALDASSRRAHRARMLEQENGLCLARVAGLLASVWFFAVEALADMPTNGVGQGERHAQEGDAAWADSLRWGSNSVERVALTNRCDTGSPGEGESRGGADAGGLSVSPTVLKYMARRGKEMLIEDDATLDVAPPRPTDEDVRTLHFNSAYVTGLGRPDAFGEEPDPVAVRSTVDVDANRGRYELRKVELGLWGDSLWLMHELPTDDFDGSVGIEFQILW